MNQMIISMKKTLSQLDAWESENTNIPEEIQQAIRHCRGELNQAIKQLQEPPFRIGERAHIERIYKLLDGFELIVSEEALFVRVAPGRMPITTSEEVEFDRVLALVDHLQQQLAEKDEAINELHENIAKLKGKVYIVFQDRGFDDICMEKAFSTEEKAKEFIKGKNPNYWWYQDIEVE